MLTNRIGDRSKAAIVTALIEAGYHVLLPFGELRYDLVAERDGVFRRVQVKTGRLRNGVLRFNGYSTPGDKGIRALYSKAEIDDYGVYCAELRRCYLVPVEDVPRFDGWLRVEPPRSSQQRRIHLAAPYELRPSGT